MEAALHEPLQHTELTGILADLFTREHRNSRCLYAAWELLNRLPESESEPIRRSFLDESTTHPDCRDRVSQVLAKPESFRNCPPDGSPGQSHLFRMGDDKGQDDEKPEISRKVVTFAIQRTQVTNSMFETFDPSYRDLRDEASPHDNTPAAYVSWYMAVMYCRWLGAEYRLPFEAEWEYACRAGSSEDYCLDADGRQIKNDTLVDVAVYRSGNGRFGTNPVGSLLANKWGLYDVHGNVWEWCQDWYEDRWYDTLRKQHSSANAPAELTPQMPEGYRQARVLRGGSFVEGDVGDLRSANRISARPELHMSGTFGFRVVRSVRSRLGDFVKTLVERIPFTRRR